nr:hypothetical protein [Bacteroidota bacterium]
MAAKDGNRELNALISLLDEPDVKIYDHIREKIFSYGVDAVQALEDAWDHSFNDIIQKRIKILLHDIQLENLSFELNKWRYYHSNDLLQGFILIAKYQYPDLVEKVILDKIGQVIQDVWLEINNNLTPLEKIKVINHIFYDIHKFSGNKANLHSPQNSFINTIFETKKANPISLSIIYMVVAQSLKIPIYGINLPQNFIMAYANRIVDNPSRFRKENIQFYINAFNKGAVFTRREVELFIRQINLEMQDSYFLPCSNVEILHRVFNNLIHAFESAGNPEKVAELKKLQQVLE